MRPNSAAAGREGSTSMRTSLEPNPANAAAPAPQAGGLLTLWWRNMAALAVGGFACAELGKRLPVIRYIGAAASFATFIPSYLVFAHVIPTPLVASITTFTKASNFLY